MKSSMRLDIFDMHKMPEGMKEYLSIYGYSFSKKMAEWAISMMYKKGPNDEKIKITPYTKEALDALLKQNNIQLENDRGYNSVYMAAYCKADHFGGSVPGEAYLAKFVKEEIDDPDGVPDMIFCRFYSDCICKGVPIIWQDML